MHMAAQRNNAAAVRFLLNNGATKDLYKEDKVLACDMDSHAAFVVDTHTHSAVAFMQMVRAQRRQLIPQPSCATTRH